MVRWQRPLIEESAGVVRRVRTGGASPMSGGKGGLCSGRALLPHAQKAARTCAGWVHAIAPQTYCLRERADPVLYGTSLFRQRKMSSPAKEPKRPLPRPRWKPDLTDSDWEKKGKLPPQREADARHLEKEVAHEKNPGKTFKARSAAPARAKSEA